MITSHLGGRYLRQMNALLSVEPALHSRIWPVFSFIRGWRLLWMTAYVQQKKNPSLLCLVWLTSALWAGTKWVYWLGFQESYWVIEACNPQEATSWKAPHYYSRLGWWFIARMSIQLKVRLLSLESSVPFNLCCWIQQLLVVVCSWQLLTWFLLYFSSESKKNPETEITVVALINTSRSNREVLTWEGRILTGKRTSQHWTPGPCPYWGATARFMFTSEEETALGISVQPQVVLIRMALGCWKSLFLGLKLVCSSKIEKLLTCASEYVVGLIWRYPLASLDQDLWESRCQCWFGSFCSVLRRKTHTCFRLQSHLDISNWKIRLCMSGAL